ncbi:unnamed protein product [Trichogramma brassicae]|uniref:Uncharacterized protein n=1 Tax=Trichogramma brassicae TaxID=86971 RepID=A0A6H5IFB9_9HYME|nr:unnamed protein product [Trichogramma brassicae]
MQLVYSVCVYYCCSRARARDSNYESAMATTTRSGIANLVYVQQLYENYEKDRRPRQSAAQVAVCSDRLKFFCARSTLLDKLRLVSTCHTCWICAERVYVCVCVRLCILFDRFVVIPRESLIRNMYCSHSRGRCTRVYTKHSTRQLIEKTYLRVVYMLLTRAAVELQQRLEYHPHSRKLRCGSVYAL